VLLFALLATLTPMTPMVLPGRRLLTMGGDNNDSDGNRPLGTCRRCKSPASSKSLSLPSVPLFFFFASYGYDAHTALWEDEHRSGSSICIASFSFFASLSLVTACSLS